VKSIPGYFAPRAVGSDRLSPGSTFFAESSSPDTTLLLLHNCPLLLGVSTRTSRRAVGCSAAVLPAAENGSRPAVDLEAELAAALLHRWFSIAERRNL
jgi:hypothetical protein